MCLLAGYASRDVVFDESVFPFESLHPNAGALLKQAILILPPHLQNSDHGATIVLIQLMILLVGLCLHVCRVMQQETEKKLVDKMVRFL